MGENKESNLHIVEKEIEEVDEEVGVSEDEGKVTSESVGDGPKEVNQSTPITYEQMKTIAIQATQQAQAFEQEVLKLRDNNLFVRLDFLFKVVEHSTKFNKLFVDKCTNEIELLLTIPESTK